MLSDAELADLLRRAVLTGDLMLIQAVAAEAVTRYADFEPGRPVAGIYYLYRTLRQLDLDTLLERLLALADSAGLSEMDRRLRGDDYRNALVPAVEAAFQSRDKLRLLYVFDDVTGFSGGAGETRQEKKAEPKLLASD